MYYSTLEKLGTFGYLWLVPYYYLSNILMDAWNTHTHTHTHICIPWVYKYVTQTAVCGTSHKYPNVPNFSSVDNTNTLQNSIINTHTKIHLHSKSGVYLGTFLRLLGLLPCHYWGTVRLCGKLLKILMAAWKELFWKPDRLTFGQWNGAFIYTYTYTHTHSACSKRDRTF